MASGFGDSSYPRFAFLKVVWQADAECQECQPQWPCFNQSKAESSSSYARSPRFLSYSDCDLHVMSYRWAALGCPLRPSQRQNLSNRLPSLCVLSIQILPRQSPPKSRMESKSAQASVFTNTYILRLLCQGESTSISRNRKAQKPSGKRQGTEEKGSRQFPTNEKTCNCAATSRFVLSRLLAHVHHNHGQCPHDSLPTSAGRLPDREARASMWATGFRST